MTMTLGMMANKAAGDPFWSNVTSLFHFDGTNGSTTFTDSSPYALSAVGAGAGSPQISTTQSKFGGSSFQCGTSARIEVTTASSVVSFAGDFTIEAWCYITDTTGINFIFDSRYARAATCIQLRANAGKIQVTNGTTTYITGTTAATQNAWQHYALVRASGTLYAFLDGNLEGSVANSTSFVQNSAYVIGASGFTLGNNPMKGYIDEFRITNGTGRYTANFTPPPSPFPNSA